MINYIIIVNDNGELKTVTEEEMDEVENDNPDMSTASWIEIALDKQAAKKE